MQGYLWAQSSPGNEVVTWRPNLGCLERHKQLDKTEAFKATDYYLFTRNHRMTEQRSSNQQCHGDEKESKCKRPLKLMYRIRNALYMAQASTDKYSDDQLNYFRVCHVTATVIPVGLRTVFKQQWNARYKTSHGEWNDTAKNGVDFDSLTSPKERITKARELSIIKNGKSFEWDCTCLFYGILYSNCIGRNTLDPKVKKAVDDLRQYRNKYAHCHQSKVTDADFQASIRDVINAFDDLKLDTNAVKKLKSQTSFQTNELQRIQDQLDKEKKRNQEPQTFCEFPPKPSHETIARSNEVDKIIKEMKTLQSRHPNEVTHVYLSGNPGCGKSETARQIGEKVFHESAGASSKTFVFTLNASSVDTLLRSYINFSRFLRIDEDSIQSTVSSKTISRPEDKILHFIGLVNPKLAMFSSWLMIVDNVVDLKKISTFFPRLGQSVTGKGQLLVTTQDSQAIPPASSKVYHKSLSKGMEPEDAVNALCAISQHDEDKDVALEIAKALDFQPLALACIAVYMKLVNQHGTAVTWPNCLTKIKEGKHEKTEKPYLDTNVQVYSQSMATAVKMALDRVAEEDNVMMLAFQILSVLALDPIPIKYVAQYVVLCMPEEDEDLIQAHIARSSLVLISDDGQNVRVHQIVYAALQENVRYTVEGDCHSLANVILSFSELTIKDDEEPDYDFITCTKSLTPHFLTLQTIVYSSLFVGMNKERTLEVAKCISCSIGKICYINGKLESARKYLEMSITMKENFCTGIDLLTERNALGEILYDLQEFTKAKYCFEQALGGDYDANLNISKTSGLYLRALTNLGLTLSCDELGEKQEAERCVKKALPFIEKITPDFPFGGRIFNNIAMVYYHHMIYAEAKTFMEKSVACDKKKYGDNHPFLSKKYNNLAIVLNSMQEHNMAKQYLQKAIFISKHSLDENHPYISIYYGNLARPLTSLNQHEEAKKCLERALDIDERVYDDNHPTLARDLNNLAMVLKDLRQKKSNEMSAPLSLELQTCELSPV
ncbi:Kinesin light chain [Exaiptasia diaphana]|nr:Kinesin light chain [Exaiptasia diaphana]